MRIGFDARWYNDSGVGTYVAELLKALVLLQFQNASDQKRFELIVYEDLKNPVPGLFGDAITRVPLSTGKYSLASQLELKRRCEHDRIDLFHSPFYPMPLRVSCPVVVTLHDLIPFLFRTGNPLKQFVIKRAYRIAAARARRIIAVSNHTANDIKRILRVSTEKITAIHNGVAKEFQPVSTLGEAEYLAERYGIRSPYMLAASTRNWQTKNLASALKALSIAQKQSRRQFQTVIYGPTEGFKATGETWAELSLVHTGLLASAELAKLFRHALVFVFPSLYEGFGLPIVEAMACGCAVITSNAGSLLEVAGAGAQIFDPLDIIGMAEAAARLLCNPAELKLWQERALKRAADFSWSKAAKETVAVYYRAVEGTG
jgi:glycosyltransferase involved in cell wall biosynthesis